MNRILVLVFLLSVGAQLHAQVDVTLSATKDNTLFEAPTGFLSNGAGSGLYCGITTSNLIRRGLIAFDIAGQIPAGAQIRSVTLTLQITQINTFNPLDLDVGLHRVLGDWGEAGSNSTMVGGGGGALAQPGDATWIHRFAPQQLWLTPGGDFDPTASALTTTGVILGPVSWSEPGMVSDVQTWLDNPSQNFGWMLKAPEDELNNAKRFATREHGTSAFRPKLVVSYALYPGSNDDLVLESSVGATPLDLTPVKSASAGQMIAGHLDSMMGSFLGTAPLVAAQLAPSGMLPYQTQFYPEVNLDFSANTYYQVEVLYSGLMDPTNIQLLAPGGLSLSGPVPNGLAGHSILFQGFCFAPSMVTGNPWFTATDAHEFQIN